MGLLAKVKKKIKRSLILKGKSLDRFGLSGTRILSAGSDMFENCEFECSGENNVIELKGGVNLTNSKIFIMGNNNKIIIDSGCHISSATSIRRL